MVVYYQESWPFEYEKLKFDCFKKLNIRLTYKNDCEDGQG